MARRYLYTNRGGRHFLVIEWLWHVELPVPRWLYEWVRRRR